MILNTKVLIHIFSARDNFKYYSDDIVVAFQDRLYNFLTIINNISSSGQIKDRSNLTLRYGYDKIAVDLKNIEKRLVIKIIYYLLYKTAQICYI